MSRLKNLLFEVSPSQHSLAELLRRLFTEIDPLSLGSISALDFFYTYSLPCIVQGEAPEVTHKRYAVKKLINNIHRYDEHTNIIDNPNDHRNQININPHNIRISIENILEVVGRIPDNLKPDSFDPLMCSTFSTIDSLLAKY